MEVHNRLQCGDELGARAVFERFATQLISKAKNRLGPRIRQKVDPEDVVQSVFKSFFIRQAAGQFELNNWESLWGLLLQITIRKCNRWAEHYGTQRRNLRSEIAQAPNDRSSLQWDAESPDPMPSEIAVLNEMIDGLKSKLDADEWNIVSLRLQDYDLAEIGTMVSRSERTVRRVLARVRDILGTQLAD